MEAALKQIWETSPEPHRVWDLSDNTTVGRVWGVLRNLDMEFTKVVHTCLKIKTPGPLSTDLAKKVKVFLGGIRVIGPRDHRETLIVVTSTQLRIMKSVFEKITREVDVPTDPLCVVILMQKVLVDWSRSITTDPGRSSVVKTCLESGAASGTS